MLPSYHRLPAAPWLGGYGAASLRQDVIAGLIVVMMLVPQSLAYALLAGLPAEAGLFASILPLIAYALFGTSRALAVGPVAVISLMTASALAPLATPGSAAYAALALELAALSGIFLFACGVLRLGVLSHLLSHPVINGFMAGSAVLIMLGQLMPLLGLRGRGQTGGALLQALITQWPHTNGATATLGGMALLLLALAGRWVKPLGRLAGLRDSTAALLVKLVPMLVVAGAIIATVTLDLDHRYGVAVVGQLPTGLPAWHWPAFELETTKQLLLPAGAMALVGFIESISVAQSIAMRERERIFPNRELLGLGAANLAAACTGGLPVTGGLSRSIVNQAAGARSPIAGVVVAGLLALIVSLAGNLFERLPTSVLAASIIVPMARLLDFRGIAATWRYRATDGLAQVATAAGVLVLGVEPGIAIGVVFSLLALVWAASQPHIAVLGRVPGTEQYRNVLRASVETTPEIIALRVDENLFFGNIDAVEQAIHTALANQPGARHVLLVLSSVSHIDATALERLLAINDGLGAQGIALHFAEVKGPVHDRLLRSPLPGALRGGVFRFTHEAFKHLTAHDASTPRT